MRVMRDNPSDVPDDLVESVVELGEAAVGPVLTLLGELDGKDAGDVPFVLAALRVRDPRVLEALTRRLENDPQDAALCLEMYGDPAAIPALEAALVKNTGGRSALACAHSSGHREPLGAGGNFA